MVKVQREQWASAQSEVLPLWQGEHAAETVAHCDSRLQVNPSLETLAKLEDANVLLVLTARYGVQLVGYTLTIFLPDFSCQHLLMANVMLHYVNPAFRGQGIARQLFTLLEAHAQVWHADAILVGNKAHLHYGAVFEHMGYHPYGTTYIKWVDYEAQTPAENET